MSCPVIYEIQKTQCIGNSLIVINDNFLNLREAACDNDSRIEILDNQIDDLNTKITELSSVIVPGSAKAWCKFSGNRDTNNVVSTFFTDRYIYNSFNILSVYKKAIGDYRIIFTNNFPNNRYAVVGTSTEKINTNTNTFTWFQPYNITSAYAEVRIQSSTTGSTVDPDFVSVVFY
jgi:hypothetical protein